MNREKGILLLKAVWAAFVAVFVLWMLARFTPEEWWISIVHAWRWT